jgi:acyl-homoserine-lactone acylase
LQKWQRCASVIHFHYESTEKKMRIFAVAHLLVLAMVVSGCASFSGGSSSTSHVEIRRTAFGVAHIKADDYQGLGQGMGYAQAEDVLCTIADAMLTYRGDRSRWFGGETLTSVRTTQGRAKNIDSDFFNRHVLTAAALKAFIDAQPGEIKALTRGFTQGYNQYVAELRSGEHAAAHRACKGEAWVTPLTEDDVFRRAYALNFGAGYSNFVAGIANAQPPSSATKTSAANLDFALQSPEGIGSNAYGLGEEATGGAPMLFGNPHWFWRGPDRFYQAQLTIPGKLDVSGGTFPGIPIILIGFNNDVAWSHTVSTARRMGFFHLSLASDSPTRYIKDGASVAMTAVPITVKVRGADGVLSDVTRTLYRSEYGPLVNLGALNPALAWNAKNAFAIRDVNEVNYRTYRNWLRWAQAKSLPEFIAIQRDEASVPWVNTIAVGRGSPEAWYADLGAMPNVTAEQLKTCATPFSGAVAGALPGVPMLDGSKSACAWTTEPDSKQAGAIPPSKMPTLSRRDYVANMNDSFWLTNSGAPITGFPALIGPSGSAAQSLRTRLGHVLVQDRLSGKDGQAGGKFTVETMKAIALNNRHYGAEVFKADALRLVCDGVGQVEVTNDSLTNTKYEPAKTANTARACEVLRSWNNTGESDSRGSHIWDEFWGRAARIPAAQLYAVAFDPKDPVNTPRGFKPEAASALKQAMGAALLRIEQSGIALDATKGSFHFATRNGEKIPLFGGCTATGYFTINCSENRIEQGGYHMDGHPNANTFMQIVSFGAPVVEAHTILTHAQSDDPASPHFADSTRAYAKKQWQRLPFTEQEIAAHPALTVKRLAIR